MNNDGAQFTERRLTTPRAAALAGIVFGLLAITAYTILNLNIPSVDQDTGTWLETSFRPVSFALGLVPFAGIAFLWYMGVLRDRIGLLEDKFYSTLFLGSGLLYLGLIFSGAAMAGGLMTAYALAPSLLTEGEVYIFTRAVMFRINNVYAIRMSGMFMIVLATIWVRTGVMPRLLGFITYGLALVLLLSVSLISWITLIFPSWVFLISVAVLVLNYRQDRKMGAAPVDPEVLESTE